MVDADYTRVLSSHAPFEPRWEPSLITNRIGKALFEGKRVLVVGAERARSVAPSIRRAVGDDLRNGRPPHDPTLLLLARVGVAHAAEQLVRLRRVGRVRREPRPAGALVVGAPHGDEVQLPVGPVVRRHPA